MILDLIIFLIIKGFLVIIFLIFCFEILIVIMLLFVLGCKFLDNIKIFLLKFVWSYFLWFFMKFLVWDLLLENVSWIINILLFF